MLTHIQSWVLYPDVKGRRPFSTEINRLREMAWRIVVNPHAISCVTTTLVPERITHGKILLFV